MPTTGRLLFMLDSWVMAARPRTLPAAVAPVCVGTALAAASGRLAPAPALAALTGALLIQVGVNLANDYFDFVGRVDTADRVGPVRVTQSGRIPPGQVRTAMWAVLGAAGVVGVYLTVVGGWPVALLGAAAVLSALAYSGGPYPLASHGLGDLFVFLFFGPAAVCGTYYVQAGEVNVPVLAASVPVGLLITAILGVNNLRDIETDGRAGKRTLAVMIGPAWSRAQYALLLAGAYGSLPVLYETAGGGLGLALPLLTFPMAVGLVGAVSTALGPGLNRLLAATARLALAYSLLLSVGLLLDG